MFGWIWQSIITSWNLGICMSCCSVCSCCWHLILKTNAGVPYALVLTFPIWGYWKCNPSSCALCLSLLLPFPWYKLCSSVFFVFLIKLSLSFSNCSEFLFFPSSLHMSTIFLNNMTLGLFLQILAREDSSILFLYFSQLETICNMNHNRTSVFRETSFYQAWILMFL